MSELKTRVIAGSSSVLLDSLRLGAALIVVYRHALTMWFPSSASVNSEPGNPSHASVVVFFVLSGFVIAHTTTGNDRGPLQYAQARLSRLCSIVLPALLITALIEFLVVRINPSVAAEFVRAPSWPRYLITAGFLNEIWFKSMAPPINGPLWSLSFEFWYYTIFGLWFYRAHSRIGLLLPIAACLIAGPKILLMLPIWLAGVVAYRIPRPGIKPSLAWILIGSALFTAGMAVAYLPPFPTGIGYAPLFFASQFLTDWVVGVFIALALWLLPVPKPNPQSAKWVGWLRRLADLTFPIYVLHNPLLALWQAVVEKKQNDVGQLIQVLLFALITSAILGIILEKQRPIWTKLFKWLLQPAKLLRKRTSFQINK